MPRWVAKEKIGTLLLASEMHLKDPVKLNPAFYGCNEYKLWAYPVVAVSCLLLLLLLFLLLPTCPCCASPLLCVWLCLCACLSLCVFVSVCVLASACVYGWLGRTFSCFCCCGLCCVVASVEAEIRGGGLAVFLWGLSLRSSRIL